MKFKLYDGRELPDTLITYKIDGVRAHNTPDGVVSRAGKPLYNIQMDCDVAEIYCGSWEQTVSAVRTRNGTPVPEECVYSLSPHIDSRLVVGRFDVTPDLVEKCFRDARNLGYEGLVLHTKEVLYKVKDKETYDVPVIGVIPGKGKHIGRMGALMTPMGKVGVGFTDTQRELNWFTNIVIEVECMEVTPEGKFRHPRFIRIREDKLLDC